MQRQAHRLCRRVRRVSRMASAENKARCHLGLLVMGLVMVTLGILKVTIAPGWSWSPELKTQIAITASGAFVLVLTLYLHREWPLSTLSLWALVLALASAWCVSQDAQERLRSDVVRLQHRVRKLERDLMFAEFYLGQVPPSWWIHLRQLNPQEDPTDSPQSP